MMKCGYSRDKDTANPVHDCMEKYLFIKHFAIRYLIIANLILLFLHYVRIANWKSQINNTQRRSLDSFSSSHDHPPIIQDALVALVVDEISNKRYEVVWEAWRYLKYKERFYAIGRIATDLDEIEPVKSRIEALNKIAKLSPKWKKSFIERYNMDHRMIQDPFPSYIPSPYCKIISINQWQIANEMQYLEFIHRYGMEQRHCLLLDAQSNERDEFCSALLNFYKKNSTNQLGYHALVMYFMNWPVDKPLDPEISISDELIESSVSDACNSFGKFNMNERVDILFKQLDAFLDD